ncbi:DOMON-like domain-containing protein [Synechococcus sp. ROS8604]|uniref:DOMON-like domain-containing protein n=1 Tax=Synechococcus sp. ROS8604 TaxID=1442557 RepID=UPI0016466B8D|nr:DOMON-like domain-containing protein [Synechococcus sp. ROS8604]QNI88155.1 hypothetical protein SynROS8604_01519 [Synechococcus sp. ROS8604]
MSRHPVMVRQVCPLLPQEPQESPNLLLSAEFVWREGGVLELSYNLRPSQRDSDLLALALPCLEPTSGPATGSVTGSLQGDRRDELWKHSCFEAFIGLPDSQQYWELNVSPLGHWNLYSFERYRQSGSGLVEALPPAVTVRQTRRDFRCDVVLDLRPWWPIEGMPELGLTMVLEETNGRLSYWALSHPGEAADFHDRRSFLTC